MIYTIMLLSKNQLIIFTMHIMNVQAISILAA